jgi:uncharacterized membrane protein YoaK (UPF0700 family)
MKLDLRNAHISLAVGVVVLVIGCFLFRDSGEDALQMVALAMLVVTFGTFIVLEDRDERRHERDQ